MQMGLCFEYKNQLVYLPVNPSELTIKSPGDNKTDNVIKLGEINILREIKLSELVIESFFPILEDAPYVLTKGKFKKPQFYIDFFTKIRNAKEPCLFVVTGTKISMFVSIEDFDWGYKAGDDDIYYTLPLKQYRPYQAVPMKSSNNKVQTDNKKKKRTSTSSDKFSIGDEVIVDGNYYYSSYGDEPHGTFRNFSGKISHIVGDKKRKYGYHITTPSGGFRGWVKESQMKHR